MVSPEEVFSIQLPNAAADAPLEGEAHRFTLVEILAAEFSVGL